MTTLREAATQALKFLEDGNFVYPTELADNLKAALPEPVLQTCNCRWDGEVQVQQCTLHEAHVDAIHEWAERAKTAEKKLAALADPVQQGCDHCNSPLYAAIKCRVCGRETPIIEPEIKGDNKPDVADDLALIVRNAIAYINRLERQINELKRAAPPQRKPLSEDEALDIARTFGAQPWPPGSCVAFARAIEAKHGIGVDE